MAVADEPFNFSGLLQWLSRLSRDRRMTQPAIAVASVLGEHANRQTGRCHPGVATLMESATLPRTTVIRALKVLEETGWLTVERRNGSGNRYLLTSPAHGTGSMHGTGTKSGLLQGKTGPVRGTDPVPCMEPELEVKAKATGGTRLRATRSSRQTFDQWRESWPEGYDPFPADHVLWRWARDTKIPSEWITLAMAAFEDRYEGNPKRYLDWPRVFLNALRGDWLKLWRFDAASGLPVLTTVGEQYRLSERAAA